MAQRVWQVRHGWHGDTKSFSQLEDSSWHWLALWTALFSWNFWKWPRLASCPARISSQLWKKSNVKWVVWISARHEMMFLWPDGHLCQDCSRPVESFEEETLQHSRTLRKGSIQQKEKLDDMLGLIQLTQDELETGVLVSVTKFAWRSHHPQRVDQHDSKGILPKIDLI